MPDDTLPQPFINRLAAGQELLKAMHSEDAFEAAARRQREAVKPSGGRQESPEFASAQDLAGRFVGHLFYNATIAPIVAARDITQQALRGEPLATDDPETIAKAFGAAGLGVGIGTAIPRVTSRNFARVHIGPEGPEHQVIGPLPEPEHFQTAADLIAPDRATTPYHDPVKENLRDLWEQKGVHPAEAVHEAASDEFARQELAEPNPNPTDRSGIMHPRGSSVVEGTPRTSLAKTGEPHIDAILDSEVTNRAIDNPVIVDKFDVPYGAGGSEPLENPTVYLDRHLPRSMTVDGVTFDPADPFVIHENLEQHVMENLIKGGMSAGDAYRVAHFEFAEKAEGAWYRAHGIDQAKAEAAYKPYLDQIEHENPENPPPNLYLKPYPHDNVRAAAGDHTPFLPPEPELIERAKAILAKQRDGEPAARLNAAGTDRAAFDAVIADIAKLSKAEVNTIQKAYIGGRDAWPTKRAALDALEMEFRERAYQEVKLQQVKKASKFAPDEAPPAAGGADVTRPENLPSLQAQPAPRAGSLAAGGREAIEQLLGLGKNLQYMLDPMATGAKQAMVVAKDAINVVRRIHYERNRAIADVERTFDVEQRTRMWNAADEESVARQLGESTEHQGLITLEPHERSMVEYLQAKSQAAWQHAVDVGIVHGEGLPSYTPRMVLNIAAAGEGMGPRALNELGRNVFTRTAQMLHRGNLMAEETEAAAKELVASKLRAAGKSDAEIAAAVAKVQIARDIRALPIATAKLEEAAVWREMINKIEETGKAAGTQTVAVGHQPEGWFTIAGHPSFTRWEPRFAMNEATGKMEPVKANGEIVFDRKPIYMHPDFKGPMKAVLEQSSWTRRLIPEKADLYSAMMAIKSRSMLLIMNSPLIHNAVVWGKVVEAVAGRAWLGIRLYIDGNRMVKGNPARAGELIEAGLAPMGSRGSFQDITGMMEEPNLAPGRSFTARVLRMVPDLFDEARPGQTVGGPGDKVAAAIDKAGNFYHNTLLWDRVRDVQFGLADHLSDRLVAQGTSRLVADRIAAHFSNIIVGSIPREAMSAGAREIANMLLFSRSFTLGNLSTFKQGAFGLPKPILAQIERDFGVSALPPQAIEAASKMATGMARRKALSTIGLSVGLFYIGNSLLQNAMNIVMMDSSVSEEMKGYARRFAALMNDASKNPLELRYMISRLSATANNEPGKQDRIHIGYDKDGAAIYARNPVGKFGEEMQGYLTKPLAMLSAKLNPPVGGFLQLLENDAGFGRKIYDENDTNDLLGVGSVIRAFKHIAARMTPESQLQGFSNLLRDQGDPKVAALKAFGPVFGFTASTGAPGGQQKGEMYSVQDHFKAQFDIHWPDIRRQIQRGDVAGAREVMTSLGIPTQGTKINQNSLIRAVQNPSRISGPALREFLATATDRQKERFFNAPRKP